MRESARRFRGTLRTVWPALLLLRAAAVGAETNAPATPQRPRGSLTEGLAGYKYLCYVPTIRTNAAQRLPLILFLHGACPNDDLTKLRHFGPIKYGLTNADFRFIVVCPATARGWTLPALIQLLDHVQATLPVDPDRVYVTGYSMGGHGTWMLALAYPHRFAAIAPVAGAGDPQEAARKLKHLPVWIFHGQNDDVVPVSYGESMARALESAGGRVKTTFYPDKGHDVWDTPYAGPELYGWFLQQRRGGSPPSGAPSRAASRTTNAAAKPSTPVPR
jgi:predicted peptidase